MPAPSLWMIRCSLGYLILGFILGAMMLVNKVYPMHPAIWALMPVHIEMLIFGWIIQFTMGTAYWILPRFLKDSPRGSLFEAEVMVILLNFGIGLVILSHLGIPDLPLMGISGRILEAGSVVLFVLLHWKRITTYNIPKKKSKH